MRVTRMAIPLVALSFVALLAPSAAAQATKKADGTVTAISGNSITVKVADQDMTFAVDKDTKVQTPGGGTKTRQAQAAGAEGVKISDVIKVGEAVEVMYQDMGGTMHAASIRTMAKVPPPANPAAAAKTTTGTVKDVSATSLTVTSAGKDMTFTIDDKTRAVGKGLGTATKATGGKAPITDLVAMGDKVSVTYHDMEGTLHAATVRVTEKAAKK